MPVCDNSLRFCFNPHVPRARTRHTGLFRAMALFQSTRLCGRETLLNNTTYEQLRRVMRTPVTTLPSGLQRQRLGNP